MDFAIIPTTEIVEIITDGTTGYLLAFLPVIVLVAAIVLAFNLAQSIVDLFYLAFFNQNRQLYRDEQAFLKSKSFDTDDDIANYQDDFDDFRTKKLGRRI